MKTNEFISKLRAAPTNQLLFVDLDGHAAPSGYHLTELKSASFDTVDCGGQANQWQETIVQLWVPEEEESDEFMTAKKFLSIYDRVSGMIALDPVLLSLELGGKGIDVYHSTQLSLPARRDFAAVVTIHDLAPLIWPAHYLRLPYSRIGHAWQYALARRADAVIAVSEATKRDVVGRLRVPEERVTVVPEAVDSDFDPPPADEGRALARARFAVPDRYVLYVGQFDPRKNVRGLLRAFAAAAERDKDLRLVIVGDLGKLSSHLRDALETERLPQLVQDVAPVADVDLLRIARHDDEDGRAALGLRHVGEPRRAAAVRRSLCRGGMSAPCRTPRGIRTDRAGSARRRNARRRLRGGRRGGGRRRRGAARRERR